MNECKYGSLTLGLQFGYSLKPRKRFYVIETIDSVQYQVQDFVDEDTEIEFRYPFCGQTDYSYFKSAFESHSVLIFTDYDGAGRNVVIGEFQFQEIGGDYSINGVFRILP